MINIKHLQKCAIPLGPDSTQREYLLKHVIAYANDYLDNISEAPAYIPRPDGGRDLWDFPITEDGIDIKQALALLRKNMDADDFNRQLVETIQQDRRIFISSTRIDGKLVLRTAVLCFRTHLDDVNEALDVLKHTAEKLEAA